MSLGAKFAAQFRKPEGRLGAFAGWIMAHRGSNRQRNEWTVQLLEIAPGDRVLEFGCGPGLALAAAAARATAGRVVGVDHSPVMIEQARARVRKLGLERQVELRLGGVEALATLPGPFDKILSVNVVQFVPDQPALLAHFHRLLAPGGRLATTYMPRHRGATADDARQTGQELERLMTVAGFTEVRTEELPLKPVPAICVLGSRAP
ncbi:MAG TPA: class I SAM-dependent methyltransferase [Alphaproteobacteria bacterium]